MRDILKRIFIGVAIGMALFFLKSEVFALETSVFQAYSSNQSGSFAIGGTGTPINSRVYKNLPFDYNYTNTEGYDYIQFSISATLTSGNTNTSAQYTAIPLIMGAYIVGNDTTAYCESTFSSIKCPIKKGSSYSRLTIFFTTPTATSAVSSISYFVDQRFMVFSSEVKQGVAESTQEQTDEIMNTDEPASATYDNDYSTQSYDQAEQSIASTLNTDVSSLTWDPTTWVYAFSWIWSTLTSFVQINGKVFATITGFLTFSFVGLVLNR